MSCCVSTLLRIIVGEGGGGDFGIVSVLCFFLVPRAVHAHCTLVGARSVVSPHSGLRHSPSRSTCVVTSAGTILTARRFHDALRGPVSSGDDTRCVLQPSPLLGVFPSLASFSTPTLLRQGKAPQLCQSTIVSRCMGFPLRSSSGCRMHHRAHMCGCSQDASAM